jgi:hypothetical protein
MIRAEFAGFEITDGYRGGRYPCAVRCGETIYFAHIKPDGTIGKIEAQKGNSNEFYNP